MPSRQVESSTAGVGGAPRPAASGLDQLSVCLRQRFSEAQAKFQALDAGRKGSLNYPELGRLLSQLLPDLGSKEKRHIFS